MKKIGAAIILILLLMPLLAHLGKTQAAAEDNQVPLGITEDKVQDVKNKTQQQWDYFANEWQKTLLKKPWIAGIDSGLQNVSWLCQILFGEPYSLSLVLLIVIILWAVFFVKTGEILSVYSMFSKAVSWLMALGLTIILAQLTLLRKISEGLLKFAFGTQNVGWRIVIFGIFIISIVVYTLLMNTIIKKLKKSKEEKNKDEIDAAAQASKKITGAIEEVGGEEKT